MSELAVVVPNHLPHLDFLNEWDELKDVPLIVVQDIGAKPEPPAGWDVQVVDHADISSDLGDDAWIIPSRSISPSSSRPALPSPPEALVPCAYLPAP